MVGLVAQDGAAGMVGDDCGDAHQAQADRPGLPGAGGGGGQGEQLGEGQQACGPGPRSGTRYGSGRTPARESGQARVFRAADTVPWQRARSRWRTSRSASWPTLVLVAKAVGR